MAGVWVKLLPVEGVRVTLPALLDLLQVTGNKIGGN